MLEHTDRWNAIDRLAEKAGLTASGLAKRAGLDATTFNKSKRVARDGKPRWPSTESLSKIMEATGTSVRDFMMLIDSHAGEKSVAGLIPMISLRHADGPDSFSENGTPMGGFWDQVHFPVITDPDVYALEILGEAWEPIYRDGDIVIVSPGASIRRGDRVLFQLREGDLMIMELLRETANYSEFRTLGKFSHDERFPVTDVLWMSRIIWASQ